MRFQFLSADAEDGEAWTALTAGASSALRDLHFTPSYARIYEATYGYEARLAAAVAEDGAAIVQPFVFRPVPDLEPQSRDVANPYGFGGPLYLGDDTPPADLIATFRDGLAGAFADRATPCEFCSLHPFFADRQKPLAEALGAEPTYVKDVIYVDTSASPEAIRASISRGARAKASKAVKAGVSVREAALSTENLALFQALYLHTMRRNQASTRWFFPDDYFPNCVRFLGAERCALLFAIRDGVVASAYFLIHDENTCYYHFGASDEAHFDARPNDLLMLESAQWCARRGIARYHLGGGVTSAPDDPLLRFKASFGKHGAPLFTYFRVHDAVRYAALVAARRQVEIKTHGRESGSDFLPAYNRPFIDGGHRELRDERIRIRHGGADPDHRRDRR